jgi:lipoprotein-anchoring transpeptidase ErfK/SrfK
MKFSGMVPLAALALLLVGCATQYPTLPEQAGYAGEQPGSASRSSVEPEPADLIDRAPVSDVAKREARLPPVSQKVEVLPPDPAVLPPADKRQLDIRLASQRFNYFENDQLVWSGPISSGAAEHPTPKGDFRVLAKDIDKRSGSYTNFFDLPTPMPYALQFSGPYWIHEGYLPGKPASHGCVRLRYEDARFVYERIKLGDRVVVAD